MLHRRRFSVDLAELRRWSEAENAAATEQQDRAELRRPADRGN